MSDVTQQTYASEPIDLPSRGVFYPVDSPLSAGTIDIAYMTAKHEDILTSTNLIQKGIVLDRLMDSLIVTKGVKSTDLLLGDLNAAMVAARILGYGKDYTVRVTCPVCGKDVEQTVDLTSLKTINEPVDGKSKFISITLPISKAEIVLRPLRRQDELDIETENKKLQKAIGSTMFTK
jgi:hypothetical protein